MYQCHHRVVVAMGPHTPDQEHSAFTELLDHTDVRPPDTLPFDVSKLQVLPPGNFDDKVDECLATIVDEITVDVYTTGHDRKDIRSLGWTNVDTIKHGMRR